MWIGIPTSTYQQFRQEKMSDDIGSELCEKISNEFERLLVRTYEDHDFAP
jgi:hypothetical protein